MVNYLEEFPLPKHLLPNKLIELLSPIESLDRELMIQIAVITESKNYDEKDECCRMIMTTIPESEIDSFNAMTVNDKV